MTKEQRELLKLAAKIIQQRDDVKLALAQKEAEVSHLVRTYASMTKTYCMDEHMLRNACSVFIMENG